MPNLTPGETPRILLISAQENRRDEVGAALAGRVGEYRLYWVSQPDLAAGRAQDVIPHLILVDDKLDMTSPAALIRTLVARVPGAAIIAMLEAGDLATAREAVLAGARGFVTKPLAPDDFVTTLQQALASRYAQSAAVEDTETARGRIVVFCAPKGGTGRTTLAINTAISLAQATGQSVALVDADYAAPALDVAMNLRGERSIADLLPRISQLDRQLVRGVIAEHSSGVHVILAPPPADLTSPITLPQVQQVLAWLKRMYAWVLVDLGLPMDETAFAFLDGADRIVMSVLPEMVGLRNTRLMLDQLINREYPAERVWLVLNRADMPGGISQRDIEARLRVSVKYRIPNDQALATHSVNRGVPLTISHPRSALARAFRKFAEQLVEDMAGEAQGTGGRSGGCFRRPNRREVSSAGQGPFVSGRSSESIVGPTRSTLRSFRRTK